MSEPTSVQNRELPPDVADTAQVALGLADPPATLGTVVDGTLRLLDAEGTEVGVDAMCTTGASRHEARFGDETANFHCVLDTLLLPFLVDDAGPVEITSRAPDSGEVVEISVTREDVTVDPADAVMSFGMATDPVPPAERGGTVEYSYEAFCPYINAFPDEDAYEAWAAATPEAATLSMPLADGFALARAIDTA